ncbi:hypothetical protein AFR_33735 [Actinoplanes friuliensis DSM 7358]|uniref:Uncharacterized protein n=2 Tax=Actinoplanes friuliensis TaxID=196914 RepID=U5WAI8_9ACTN|nr:hypothetical protein AFR_33735 [Actinoplanes friuliensis DSM 7358]
MINVVSLLVALIAVIVSSTLTWRALTIARNANHFPVIVSLLAPHRRPDFIRKERHLVDHLGDHDPELTLEGLPEPIRTYAIEVSEQYHMLGYVAANGLADGTLLTTQVGHGASRVWDAVQPFVAVERRNRGGEYSFFNSFELFVELARKIDTSVPDARR